LRGPPSGEGERREGETGRVAGPGQEGDGPSVEKIKGEKEGKGGLGEKKKESKSFF
jgi:hypothetical protein